LRAIITPPTAKLTLRGGGWCRTWTWFERWPRTLRGTAPSIPTLSVKARLPHYLSRA